MHRRCHGAPEGIRRGSQATCLRERRAQEVRLPPHAGAGRRAPRGPTAVVPDPAVSRRPVRNAESGVVPVSQRSTRQPLEPGRGCRGRSGGGRPRRWVRSPGGRRRPGQAGEGLGPDGCRRQARPGRAADADDRGAEVTLASIEVPIEDGRRFGIVAVDESDRKAIERAENEGLAEPPLQEPLPCSTGLPEPAGSDI